MPGRFTGTRGTAQEYISGLIKEGLTNAQIVGTLQDYGMSYRLSNMYADVNRIRLEQFGGLGLKNFDINTPIPTNLMSEWQGQTDYKFRVVIQYEYQSTDGEVGLTKATTLYYDYNPTIDEVIEDWGTRTQTLEGGFGSVPTVGRVGEIKEINYFYNVPKR